MPELPEVETIVRELRPKIVGKKFWKLEGNPPSFFKPSYDEVSKRLRGLRVLDLVRRGKFIVFVLEGKMRMVIHLRMSGRVMWKKVPGKGKHIRAIFTFSDGSSMIFSDARKFGRVWLYNEREYERASGIYRLGIEPFAADFTPRKLQEFFGGNGVVGSAGGGRGGAPGAGKILKNTLLRQDLIAGIGNIYADEICYRVRRHPSWRATKFSLKDATILHEAIRHCLQEGIDHCGASVSDFVGTKGTLGKHQLYLQVYGRTGDPCYSCGAKIKKMRVAGRGTYVCVKCQVLT